MAHPAASASVEIENRRDHVVIDVHDDAPSSAPPQIVYQGRKFQWPAIGSSLGVGTNAVSIATTGVMFVAPNPTLLYVALGANIASSVIHIGEGIVACILQPKRALEKTVEEAGRVSDTVAEQLQSLQKELQVVKAVTARQEAQLKEERTAALQAKEAVDAKIAEISRLTLNLEEVTRSLGEAHRLTESWKQATAHVAKQVSLLEPTQLEEDMEGLSRQMHDLSLSKEAFTVEVGELGTNTAIIQETQEAWGKMVDQLQTTFQGLSIDAASKRKLLEESDQRIKSLTQRVSELQEVDQRLQEMTPQYTKLLKELEEARRQLNELAPILTSAEFKKFLQKFAAAQ